MKVARVGYVYICTHVFLGIFICTRTHTHTHICAGRSDGEESQTIRVPPRTRTGEFNLYMCVCVCVCVCVCKHTHPIYITYACMSPVRQTNSDAVMAWQVEFLARTLELALSSAHAPTCLV